MPRRVMWLVVLAAALPLGAQQRPVLPDLRNTEVTLTWQDFKRLIEAAHPVPDARSLAGGRALRQTVQAMPEESTLLLLVSGGASSLAGLPGTMRATRSGRRSSAAPSPAPSATTTSARCWAC